MNNPATFGMLYVCMMHYYVNVDLFCTKVYTRNKIQQE